MDILYTEYAFTFCMQKVANYNMKKSTFVYRHSLTLQWEDFLKICPEILAETALILTGQKNFIHTQTRI